MPIKTFKDEIQSLIESKDYIIDPRKVAKILGKHRVRGFLRVVRGLDGTESEEKNLWIARIVLTLPPIELILTELIYRPKLSEQSNIFSSIVAGLYIFDEGFSQEERQVIMEGIWISLAIGEEGSMTHALVSPSELERLRGIWREAGIEPTKAEY